MNEARFVFWELMKALCLIFAGLLVSKAVSGLRARGLAGRISRLLKAALYLAVLALVLVGARSIGYDAASEVYRWSAGSNLRRPELAKAYDNALQAVRLRPGSIANWRMLAEVKLAQHQFESLLDDLSAFRSLSGGDLDEEDGYRFALCYFYLGQYDKLVSASERLIERNRSFAAPYVLQGLAYTALGKHAEAEWSFLAVLQMFPNNQAAVEGLAHDYFLAGQRARALAVLNATSNYRFPPEVTARFTILKRLYAQ